MLSDVASALQTQARQMTARFEEFRDGLLGLMGLLGEDRDEIMGQCAHVLVNLDAIMLKFSGDGDKREGVEGEVRMLVNQLAQGALPGTGEAGVAEAIDEMAESLGEGTSMTLSAPGLDRPPVTLRGRGKKKPPDESAPPAEAMPTIREGADYPKGDAKVGADD